MRITGPKPVQFDRLAQIAGTIRARKWDIRVLLDVGGKAHFAKWGKRSALALLADCKDGDWTAYVDYRSDTVTLIPSA